MPPVARSPFDNVKILQPFEHPHNGVVAPLGPGGDVPNAGHGACKYDVADMKAR